MIENNTVSLKEDINKKEINEIDEKEIAKNLKEYCKNPLFYTLSTEKIKSIINESDINKENDIDTICNVLNSANEYKIEESPLLFGCTI